MGIKFSHDHSNSAINDNNHHQDCGGNEKNMMKINGDEARSSGFKIPLHYPKYIKKDYEKMTEWQLDQLLREYGLPIIGDSFEKRKFVIGAFLWSPENDY